MPVHVAGHEMLNVALTIASQVSRPDNCCFDLARSLIKELNVHIVVSVRSA